MYSSGSRVAQTAIATGQRGWKRQPAGGLDKDVPWPGRLVDEPDDLRLRQVDRAVEMQDAIDLGVPGRA